MELTKNESRKRYEARIDGKLAGFAEYIAMTGLVIMSHTEVKSDFEGQGVGSALARYALNDIRAQESLQAQPLCPFISGWIDRHPDYQDLVR